MPQPSWMARLGLDRPELRAWAMYDWANSAFMVVVVTALFPNYFASVAAADLPAATATTRLAIATTVALGIVAVLGPMLGAYADLAERKKRLLAVFLTLGASTTGALYFIGRGDWLPALLLFLLANIGASGSMVFYDSLLPHVAREEEIDRVSSAGYALGYLGGGVLFAANVVMLAQPGLVGIPSVELAARLSFLMVAIWWVAFSIPLLRRVPEPRRALELDERGGDSLVRIAFSRLRETASELRLYRHAFLMLVAFALYNDGINTIIRMSSIYGTEIGIESRLLMLAFLMVQFVGVPFAFLFGAVASRIGAKRAIFISLVVYVGISVLGYYMSTAWHFFLLAGLVATVQGGSQALSRSLFATMIPRHKSSEFFGFFGIFEKFAGVLGPMLFAVVIATTGTSRLAVLSVILFFVAGGFVLSRVDVEEGQRRAREAEAQLTGTAGGIR